VVCEAVGTNWHCLFLAVCESLGFTHPKTWPFFSDTLPLSPQTPASNASLIQCG